MGEVAGEGSHRYSQALGDVLPARVDVAAVGEVPLEVDLDPREGVWSRLPWSSGLALGWGVGKENFETWEDSLGHHARDAPVGVNIQWLPFHPRG